MKEIIKSINTWTVLWFIRLITPLFIWAYAVLLHAAIRDQDVLNISEGITIKLSYIFLILFLIPTVLFIYANIILFKGTSKKVTRKPYRVELGLHSKDEVCSLLNEKLEFNTVAEDCMYASASTGKADWRTFVFLFDEQNPADGIDIAEQYVKKINEMTGFSPAGRTHTSHHTQRIQLFIYNSVPQCVLDKAQESVYSDNIHYDILTNFFIDLQEGVLYIPFLCTRTDVGILHPPYRRAIEQVGEYLDLI